MKPIISRNRSASELFSKSVRRFIISSVIGGSSNKVGSRNPTLPGEPSMADRKLLVRYSAMKARWLAACSAELHHSRGHDLRALTNYLY